MRRAQERVDLRGGEEDGEPFLRFGQRHDHQRIGGQPFALAEEAVKAAQRGEIKTDGGARTIALHQSEKIRAEVIGCCVVP
jgi:hypothetical protein